MVDWNKTWIAVTQSGGGGASFIIGGGLYVLPFVNVADPRKMILAAVTCKRLGVVIHAGASHAIGIMVGVGSTSDMEGLTGGGYDFAADLGAKWGQIVKQGGRIGKWLGIIEAAFKGMSAGARAGLAKGTEIVFSEAAKGLVNEFAGNFDLDEKRRGFYMFGTPVGIGIGAGVWYEWQSVWALGGPQAWDYGQPQWRLQPYGSSVLFQVRNIPEPNGTDMKVYGFRVKEWGTDPYIDFGTPNARGGVNLADFRGESKGFRFFASPAQAGAHPSEGGTDLKRYKITGKYEYFGGFMQGRGIRSISYDSTGQEISIAPDISVGGRVVWQADEYIKIKVGSDKTIQTVFNGNPSVWRN